MKSFPTQNTKFSYFLRLHESGSENEMETSWNSILGVNEFKLLDKLEHEIENNDLKFKKLGISSAISINKFHSTWPHLGDWTQSVHSDYRWKWAFGRYYRWWSIWI